MKHPGQEASPPVVGDAGNEGVDDILSFVGGISDLVDNLLFYVALVSLVLLPAFQEHAYHSQLTLEGCYFVLHATQQIGFVCYKPGQVLQQETNYAIRH